MEYKTKETNGHNTSITSLDSFKNNRNSSCGKWSLRKRPTKGCKEYFHTRMYCKTWKCGACAPRKANQARKAIAEQAVSHKLNKLLTLTLDPRNCTAEESPEYIKSCWNKMRVYFDRKATREGLQKISFIQVIEFQKNGYAHLHILIDQFVNHAWIKDAWSKLGGGKIVDIRYVDIHRIPNYLSKYLTKQTILSTKGKLRRFTSSRNIKLFIKKKSEGIWDVIKEPLEIIRNLAGIDCVNEQNGYLNEIKSFSINYDIFRYFPKLELLF